MTADVRRTPRRGTPSACAHQAHAPDAGTRDRRMRKGTRPSLGPSTRARQSSLCSAGASQGGEAFEQASRLGKPGSPGRNQHWGFHEWTMCGSPRVTALAREAAWHVEEKEGDQGLRPCEDCKSPGSVARTLYCKLQKSLGDGWSRISSAYALQKGRQGRVNGGLARSEGRRVKPQAVTSSENARRESASPLKTGEDRRRPRVARDRHSAVLTSPKAVRGSRDRGCKGHRIL